MALKTVPGEKRLETPEKLFLLLIVLYAFASALFANSHFTVEDAAIHSEIAGVIKGDFYPETYGPVANVQFTYPPLFYYLALVFSFFGLSVLDSVKMAGALSFAFFPAALYFLGSLFGKRAGLFSAMAALLSSNIFMVLIFSEYPEILSFGLFAMFVYFYFRGKYSLSGIFLGLTALTHPFTAFFAAISAIFLFIFKRDKNTAKTISVGLLISLFWLPKYIGIFSHFLSGAWNNLRWYGPNGFIGLRALIDTVFRLNPIVVLLSLVGIAWLLSRRKEIKAEGKIKFFLFLYLFPLIFIIYHYSPAQYKFLDIFAIPVSLFFGIGADYFFARSKSMRHRSFVPFIALLALIASLFIPVLKINEYQAGFSAISSEVAGAAEWLGEYDATRSRIVLALNSSKAFKESPIFESELVFSQISDKIPLDGTISDLEAYTPEYEKQLEDRENIIKGNFALLPKYDVKYFISGEGICPFERIYSKNGVEICRVKTVQ